MKIIITESQYNFLLESEQINPENLNFFEKFYEEEKFLPTYKTLENLSNKKVGDYLPEHPKANVNLKTFVNKYVPELSLILSLLEKKYGVLPTKKESGYGTYVSIDGKYRFKSLFENIFYNIFVENGVGNELEYESRDFYKDCKKIPDFLLENEKKVIEIAGMEKQDYLEKLQNAKECFKNKGYETIIINVRKDQKNHRYIKFYENISELFGFPIREDILENPIKIINYKNIDKNFMQDYIDEHINRFDRKRGETDMLAKFVKHLGYDSINDYKRKKGLIRFKDSVSLEDVVELVKSGMKYDDIANQLGISRTGLDKKILHTKEIGKLPNEVINKDLRDIERRKVADRPSKEELEKDLEELGSYNAVGKKYGVSHAAIKKWMNK
jgi:predicted transcriptional regulator